jgi:hypothetical protein
LELPNFGLIGPRAGGFFSPIYCSSAAILTLRTAVQFHSGVKRVIFLFPFLPGDAGFSFDQETLVIADSNLLINGY